VPLASTNRPSSIDSTVTATFEPPLCAGWVGTGTYRVLTGIACIIAVGSYVGGAGWVGGRPNAGVGTTPGAGWAGPVPDAPATGPAAADDSGAPAVSAELGEGAGPEAGVPAPDAVPALLADSAPASCAELPADSAPASC